MYNNLKKKWGKKEKKNNVKYGYALLSLPVLIHITSVLTNWENQIATVASSASSSSSFFYSISSHFLYDINVRFFQPAAKQSFRFILSFRMWLSPYTKWICQTVMFSTYEINHFCSVFRLNAHKCEEFFIFTWSYNWKQNDVQNPWFSSSKQTHVSMYHFTVTAFPSKCELKTTATKWFFSPKVKKIFVFVFHLTMCHYHLLPTTVYTIPCNNSQLKYVPCWQCLINKQTNNLFFFDNFDITGSICWDWKLFRYQFKSCGCDKCFNFYFLRMNEFFFLLSLLSRWNQKLLFGGKWDFFLLFHRK